MTFKNILTSAFLLLLVPAGCTDTSQKPTSFSELTGLKIQDLKSPAAPLKFPKIIFDVVLFKMPSKKTDSIKTAFEPLKNNSINFTDRSAFECNGLFAVRGLKKQSPMLTATLASLNAKRFSRASIILFEQKGELLPAGFSPAERYLLYTENDGTERTIITPPGQMAWQLQAACNAFVRDLVHVRLMPVFNTPAGDEIANMAGLENTPKQTFPHQQITLDMRKGDFVLLAPNRLDERTTLNSLLFHTADDRTNVLVYVIICTKTEN